MRNPTRMALWDRREALVLGMGALSVSLPACHAFADGRVDILTRQLGIVPTNDQATGAAWGRWLGRGEGHDLLYFNQDSWPALSSSIAYIANLGHDVLKRGRLVHWSVPVGGVHAYLAVASGAQDALYSRAAAAILAAYAGTQVTGRICVRLPWEFNLESQTLAARGEDGRWDAKAYIAAYRRIAGLFRAVSSRFYFDWCPNIGRGGIDPESCYPGDDLVDVVSLDVYYRAQYDDQGHQDASAAIFRYRREQPFGLDWLAAFGKRHGKLIGLSEWGVDDDRATAFMQMMVEWIVAQGTHLAHHTYWDRNDGGVFSRLSDGRLHAIGAVYRGTFGRR